MLAPLAAKAGRQIEEPLADSVRTALAAAVSDSGPPHIEFEQFDDRLAYLRWLGAMGERLKQRKPDFNVRREFLETVWYESKRAGLDASLVLALIEVESGFRKYAISSVGARGYMQVMPFWLRLLAPRAGDTVAASTAPIWPGDVPNATPWTPPSRRPTKEAKAASMLRPTSSDEDVSRMFHLQTNLRFGCVILRHYLDREQGSLFLALGSYNGSRGQSAYPDMVLAARKRWVLESAAQAAAQASAPAAQVTPATRLPAAGLSGRLAVDR
jgi:hypothetical protein